VRASRRVSSSSGRAASKITPQVGGAPGQVVVAGLEVGDGHAVSLLGAGCWVLKDWGATSQNPALQNPKTDMLQDVSEKTVLILRCCRIS
jgi:hypothetical protein